jgi:hypothetical protein
MHHLLQTIRLATASLLQHRQLLLHSRQRDLLESVHHLEAVLVFRRKYSVARPVDHQRLHPSSDRSLDLLDVVAEEEDDSGLKLNHSQH